MSRLSLNESLSVSDAEGGDLGLGFGRKPGGIVISDDERSFSDEEEQEEDEDKEEQFFDDLFSYTAFPHDRDADERRNTASERNKSKLSSFDEFFRLGIIDSNDDNNNKNADNEPFKVSDVLRTKKDRLPLKPKDQKLLHKNLKNYIADFILSRRSKKQRHPSSSSSSSAAARLKLAPSRHGVSIGTSMRQERALFHQELEKLDARRELYKVNSLSGSERQTESDAECGGGSDGGFLWRNRKRRLLESRLRKAEEEIASLKAEVEKKDEMLAAKQKAVKIMQAQVQQVTAAKEAIEEKSRKRIEFLEKEINGVRFESEYKQGSFLFSQETWAQRFDRVSTENGALMKTLEAKSEQVRELHLRIDNLQREKDDLIAMWQGKEKEKIAHITEISSGDGNLVFI